MKISKCLWISSSYEWEEDMVISTNSGSVFQDIGSYIHTIHIYELFVKDEENLSSIQLQDSALGFLPMVFINPGYNVTTVT
jgi:hypothetical protein